MNSNAPQLKNITCRVCGRHLAWTLPSASILCPGCHTWTKPKKPKKENKRSKAAAVTEDLFVQQSLWDGESGA